MTKDRRINPHFIGFDSVFDQLFSEMNGKLKAASYPPHDIIKIDNKNYRVDVAVAGFDEDEVSVTLDRDVVKIIGKHKNDTNENYLYKGIAKRDFELLFKLYNRYQQIDNAILKDGILSIHFVSMIPEDQLPKQITIQKS